MIRLSYLFKIIFSIIILIGCAHKQVKSPGKNIIKVNEFLVSTGKFQLILEKARSCYNSPIRVLNSTLTSLHKKILKDKKIQRDFKTYNSLGLCYLIREDFMKADFYFKIALSLAKNREERSAIYNNLGILFVQKNHLFAQLLFKKSLSERQGFENSFNASWLNSSYNVWDPSLIDYVEKNSIEGEVKNILLANFYFYNANYSRALSYFNLIKERKIIEKKIGENYLWSLIKLNRIGKASVFYKKYSTKLSVDKLVMKEKLKNAKSK